MPLRPGLPGPRATPGAGRSASARRQQQSGGSHPATCGRRKLTGMLETASEVVFQELGGGRVACGGELYLLPGEVQPVMDALEGAGLHVTALHNHMVDEQPTMYWMHWYATGQGTTFARAVSTALSHMNAAPESEAEGQ